MDRRDFNDVNLAAAIPINIAGTKTSVPLAARERDVTAGPGQNPPSPQPIPNIAAPASKRKSKSVLVGRLNTLLKNGVFRF